MPGDRKRKNSAKQAPAKRPATHATATTHSAEQEEMIIVAILTPHLVKMQTIKFPDDDDPQPSYDINTTAKPLVDWTQAPVTYASNHPLAGQTITDPSSAPLQLNSLLGDELTQALIQEVKNTPGACNAYRAVNETGSTDFPVSCGVTITAAAGLAQQAPANTCELRPACAIADSTIVTGSLSATPFTTFAGAFPSGFPEYSQYHGPLLPVGFASEGARTYVWNDRTSQASSAGAATLNTADLGTAASANLLSSCVIVQAGTGGLSAGDEINISLYGFNENNDVLYGGAACKIASTVLAGGFVCAIPTVESDYFRVVATITVNQTAGTSFTGATLKRNLSWGVAACGGVMAHLMAPAVNDAGILSQYTSTRLLANGLDADNWSNNFQIGARAASYQAPLGTYWQSQGFDQRQGVYSFLVNKPGESDDGLKFGTYLALRPAGSDRWSWRDNVDLPSTLNVVNSGAQFGKMSAKFNLDKRNQAQMCLLAPVPGTNGAQAVQLSQTAICEVQTQTQTLKQALSPLDPAAWSHAVKRVGRMKCSAIKPNPFAMMATENFNRPIYPTAER